MTKYYINDLTPPRVFMSKSVGFYRVINQGLPICSDKRAEQEALDAAKQMKLIISNTMAWDGDARLWYNPEY